MQQYTVLEYCYRDASNYRVNGVELFSGALTASEMQAFRRSLIDKTWFVAEAVGLPSLQGQLLGSSGSPTPDDHDWHEFVRLRPATETERLTWPVRGSIQGLATRVAESSRIHRLGKQL